MLSEAWSVNTPQYLTTTRFEGGTCTPLREGLDHKLRSLGAALRVLPGDLMKGGGTLKTL